MMNLRAGIAVLPGLMLLHLLGCAAPSARVPATAPTATQAAADPDAPSPQDLALEAKLDQHLPELRYNAVPLSQVLDDIRNKSGANIIVEWPALASAGIGKDAPVTARLRDVKVSKALQLVFKSVDGEDDDHKLAYCVTNGGIVVTSRRRPGMKEFRVTRSYDVSFLFVGAAPATDPIELANRVKDIKNYVTDNVDTATWKDNGGDLGEISLDERKHVLIVTQMPDSQRKVRSVLDSLRESQK